MLFHALHQVMAIMVMTFMGALFFVRFSHGYQFPSALALQSVLSIKSSSSILNHACVPSTTTTSTITSSTVQQQQSLQSHRHTASSRLIHSANQFNQARGSMIRA